MSGALAASMIMSGAAFSPRSRPARDSIRPIRVCVMLSMFGRKQKPKRGRHDLDRNCLASQIFAVDLYRSHGEDFHVMCPQHAYAADTLHTLERHVQHVPSVT